MGQHSYVGSQAGRDREDEMSGYTAEEGNALSSKPHHRLANEFFPGRCYLCSCMDMPRFPSRRSHEHVSLPSRSFSPIDMTRRFVAPA